MKVTRLDHQTQTKISIHYEILGQGKETLVFHHGNGNSIKDWHHLGFVDCLKNDFRLVLIDSRGYGDSDKPHDAKEYSLKSRADDTIAVLDQENIQEPVHCLGASIGASLCFVLARFYPHRFKSYIFATPYFELFNEEIKQALSQSSQAYVAKLEEKLGQRFQDELIRTIFLNNDHKAVLAANSAAWFNYLEYVPYVQSPSLIYAGSKESSSPKLYQLQLLLPNCTFEIIPNATHAQMYWDAKGTTPLIRDFILRNSVK